MAFSSVMVIPVLLVGLALLQEGAARRGRKGPRGGGDGDSPPNGGSGPPSDGEFAESRGVPLNTSAPVGEGAPPSHLREALELEELEGTSAPRGHRPRGEKPPGRREEEAGADDSGVRAAPFAVDETREEEAGMDTSGSPSPRPGRRGRKRGPRRPAS